jgi:uncharacterized protein YbjT (DUF2867 family)
MSRNVQPRDEREARAWYCADLPSARWGPGRAERKRQPITRELVADMIARAAAASGPYQPPRIQQIADRTPADRRRIAEAIDYITGLGRAGAR